MARSGLISTLMVMAVLVMAILLAPAARSQDAARPPVGGVISPPDAMIFYLAHGPDGVCGPNCSEWIAAEGVVEWDTFKRLFAFAGRLGRGRSQSRHVVGQDHSRARPRCERGQDCGRGMRRREGRRLHCAQAQRQIA